MQSKKRTWAQLLSLCLGCARFSFIAWQQAEKDTSVLVLVWTGWHHYSGLSVNSIVPAEVETFHSQHFQGEEELLSHVCEVFLRRPELGLLLQF